MREYHRYLGFFLAGIMAVYALSGTLLIFRKSEFLKQDVQVEKTLAAGLKVEEVAKEIRYKELNVKSEEADLLVFEGGSYHKKTGETIYTKKELPFVLDKMTHMHKATTDSPLFFLNIFFGASLLFFVLSAFWMFMPGSNIFKKGMYFALAGIVLTLIMVFV